MKKIQTFLLFLFIATSVQAQTELIRPADFRYYVTVDQDTVSERTLDYKAIEDAFLFKQMNCGSTVTVHPLGIEARECFNLTEEVVDTLYIVNTVYESIIEVVNWQHRQSAPDEHRIEVDYTGNFDRAWVEVDGAPLPDTIFVSEKVYIDVYAVKDNRTVIVRDSVDLEILNELFLSEQMATYWTDFSEYTTDQQPSDWTERWGDYDHLVKEDAGLEGGKYLEIRANGSTITGTHLFSWDQVDGDADRADFEILKRVRFVNSLTNNKSIGMGRANNAFASRDAYAGTFQAGNEYVTLEKWVNGSYSTINNETGFDYSLNTWYWMRVRVSGTTIQAKFWIDTGNPEDEPVGWDNTDTDSSITDPGWVGWGTYQDNTAVDIDVFSVATNGETAPFEDPGGGSTFEASFSIDSTLQASSSSVSTAEAGISLDTGADVSDGSTATGESLLTIAHNQNASTQSDAQAEASLSLSNLLQIAFSKQSVTDASFSLPVVHQVTTVSDTQIVNEASFSLALQKAITTEQISTIEVSYSLNAAQQTAMGSVSTAEAAMSITLSAAINFISTALAEADISFNAVQSLTFSGQTVGVEVTLADGRTLTISLENRTYLIPQETRTFTILS